jgi:hypothetical protein
MWAIALELADRRAPRPVLRYRADLVPAEDARRIGADWAAEAGRIATGGLR